MERAMYSITCPEDLRCLCIREHWFTCGSCEQYEKMFQMNEEGCPLTDIAIAIWLCSDDVPRSEITKKLRDEKMKYDASRFIRQYDEEE